MAEDITAEVKTLGLPAGTSEEAPAKWMEKRFLVLRKTNLPFLFFRSVETENEKKIILDDYSANITLMTALVSGDQMNTLACIMEQLLTDKEDEEDLYVKIKRISTRLFSNGNFRAQSLVTEHDQRWYAEVRPLDALCCINRMRGVSFQK